MIVVSYSVDTVKQEVLQDVVEVEEHVVVSEEQTHVLVEVISVKHVDTQLVVDVVEHSVPIDDVHVVTQEFIAVRHVVIQTVPDVIVDGIAGTVIDSLADTEVETT